MDNVKALSVLDGRYSRLTEELTDIFSEYGLIRHRVIVEIKWLTFLIKDLKLSEIAESDIGKIEAIAYDFNIKSAQKIKEIERTTNHDVKAVEYYIKDQLEEKGLDSIKEWIHFSCTSEDINNTSYALMLKNGKDIISKNLGDLLNRIETLGRQYKAIPMMSRTHGQPASPTTVGKEFINFAWRLKTELDHIQSSDIQAKMNGATGNYNAHSFVFPDIDWIDAGQQFISRYLEVTPLLYTTQINPYSYISTLLHAMVRAASIIIDLNRDMWGYISIGYFKQKLKEGEVGSSTMPHKVNPIDFENGEGNMGIAISMMEHLSVKLLNSRFQRDLTDSTVLRNIGAIFGYFLIGMKNSLKGLSKIDLNNEAIKKDIDENLELLAEPVQTVMRAFEEENPYEKLKALTRGKKINRKALDDMIDALEKVPPEYKDRMKQLTVENYTGLAEKLVDKYFTH